MSFDKPKKIIYSDQKKVHDKIFSFARSELEDVACEAYLVGSATTGKFGRYEENLEFMMEVTLI